MINFSEMMNGTKKAQPKKAKSELGGLLGGSNKKMNMDSMFPKKQTNNTGGILGNNKKINMDTMFPKKQKSTMGGLFQKKKASDDMDKILPRSKGLNTNSMFQKEPTRNSMFSKELKQPQTNPSDNNSMKQVRGLIKNKNPNIIIVNNYGEQRQQGPQFGQPRKVKRIMTAFEGNDKLDAVYDSDLDGIPDHLDPAPHDPEVRLPLTKQGKKNSRSNRAISSIIDDI